MDRAADSAHPRVPVLHAEAPPTVGTTGPAEEFVAALAARDFDRLEACLASRVLVRALVPSGLREREGARETAALFRSWFSEAETLEVLESSATSLVNRVHLHYRFRERYPDGETEVIEQQAFCTVEGGRVASLDLVCSGHLPEAPAQAQGARRYDAGDLGCGSGLPQEFRRQIETIPIGSVLEVHARDPAAKEDLPSLARLLGHRVVSVTATSEGSVVISVERAR